MPENIRILRRPQVEEKVGLARATLYDRLNPKATTYDPSFPRPINLGGGKNPPVGWIESELDAWLASRAAERARMPS